VLFRSQNYIKLITYLLSTTMLTSTLTEKFSVWEIKAQEDEEEDENFSASAPAIVFSAHGDTCFGESACRLVPRSKGKLFFGHMDNFAGVHAMLKAYYSGALPSKRIHCKITHGEEKSTNGVYFSGARDVMRDLKPQDFVAVIDVTGQCSRVVSESTVVNASLVKGHVVIEKILSNPITKQLLRKLKGFHTKHSGVDVEHNADSMKLLEEAPYTYETFEWCQDPQAFQDETDAYRETQENVVFLGLQTCGGSFQNLTSSGDYNAGEVFCWVRDIEAMSLLIEDLANVFVKHYDNIYDDEKKKKSNV